MTGTYTEVLYIMGELQNRLLFLCIGMELYTHTFNVELKTVHGATCSYIIYYRKSGTTPYLRLAFGKCNAWLLYCSDTYWGWGLNREGYRDF